MIPALMLIAACTHLLLPYLPEFLGGTAAAWAYVVYGLEATALWLAVSRFIELRQYRGVVKWAGLSVCAYGVFESSQRWACRLMLPMDRPPNTQSVCEAAGIHTLAFTPVAVALVALVVSVASNR